jgi:hypothetical protein
MRRNHPEKSSMKKVVSSAWQCTCTLVIGDHKRCCQAQRDSFEALAIFLGLVIARHFSAFTTKKHSEMTMIREHWGSYCKMDESTDRDIVKWFPEMLTESLWEWANVYHCLRELLWRKFWVNSSKIAYVSIINQFQRKICKIDFLVIGFENLQCRHHHCSHKQVWIWVHSVGSQCPPSPQVSGPVSQILPHCSHLGMRNSSHLPPKRKTEVRTKKENFTYLYYTQLLLHFISFYFYCNSTDPTGVKPSDIEHIIHI